ncbi:MAG: 5-methyltetrahydropteroyltriglutamate--homocysteine S-methyltransferase, partial [Lysinibacillus sp.]
METLKYTSTVVGYPYIGENREWKKALEGFWKNEQGEEAFEETLKEIRLARVEKQIELGLDYITVGDFTYYDRMLDLSVMLGMVPQRFKWDGERVDLNTYYAMARGNKEAVACEMTKWFNTNYHYIVPEYEQQNLKVTDNQLLRAFLEIKETFGITAKPTLIGPFTFCQLTKGYDKVSQITFILQLIPLYAQIIKELVEAGAEWIQLEEPSLVTTLNLEDIQLVKEMYAQLTSAVPEAKIMLQTYFESLSAYEQLIDLPVHGVGLDFVHGYEKNMQALRQFGFPKEKVLAAGVINGRDIWRANLAEVSSTVKAIEQLSDAKAIWVQSSCSLQHVPVTTAHETNLDLVLKNALSFADEKLIEIIEVAKYVQVKDHTTNQKISESMKAIEALKNHPVRNNQTIQKAVQAISKQDFERQKSFKERLNL